MGDPPHPDHAVVEATRSRAGLGWIRSDAFTFLLLVLCVAAFSVMAPGFGSPANLANLLTSCLPLLILAVGQTVVLITGGIDLSVAAIVGTTSVAGSLVMGGDVGWLAGHPAAGAVGLAVMLAVGAAIGLFNGVCIAWLRMPPFIVTLTTMMFFTGFAVWLARLGAGAETIYHLPSAFVVLGSRPAPSLILAAITALAVHAMLSRSVLGRWLYAVGHNPGASHISGVPVELTRVTAYVASGLCAALAAVLLTGRLETGSPNHGRQMLLDVIGAVAIGGTSLFGGRGKVLWTIGGVLFLAVLGNGLNAANLADSTITLVKGVVILVAAALDVWRNPASRP